MNRKLTKIGFAGAAGAVALAISGVTTHATGFTLGDAANYIILYEGNGGHHLAINNFGTTGIWTGNIGINGTGTLAATGPGIMNGDINFFAANTGQATFNNSSFTAGHGINYNVALVNSDMVSMNGLSSDFGLQVGTALIINTSSDQTVLASSGALYNGNRLFSVTSVNTGNGENLIIKGDGSQNVVVNVNTPGDAHFHGNVLLQDLTGKFYGDAGYAGLTPDQVLFNLYGGAALVGGDKLDANNNGNNAHPANIIYGTFLDPNGAISFNNTRFIGHIFGGDSVDMQIVSGDTLSIPTNTITVPDAVSTALLGLIGLGALALFRKTVVA